MNDVTLILASASPRRRELLSMTGLPFTVDAPDVDETCTLSPREAVLELSRRKALAAAALHPGCVVLAADTLVSVDDTALGKPRDEEDAFRMLRSLSGRWHQVYTGVTVVDAQGHVLSEADGTDVHFEDMTDADIRRYIATREPMDKAGAYAVQGIAGLWIDQLRGSHTNVIGLPMTLTRRLLARCGLM
ncbi:MAG: septum formation inhibitor Maf [Clostridiales bacterium]|nr:septum formation inhibitor Maf [Clostridiales bacterium]